VATDVAKQLPSSELYKQKEGNNKTGADDEEDPEDEKKKNQKKQRIERQNRDEETSGLGSPH
jgi:hypothetical protein